MLRLEARAAPSRAMAYASPVIALVITIVLGAILFASLGKDPVRGLSIFLWEPISTGNRLGELALKATPLILCAIGLSLCFRSNVWNIGAEGQLLMGAIFAAGVAIYATTHNLSPGRWGFMPIALVAGVLGGMFWAAIVAFLRDRFNANEILVSLMLVYVAQLLLGYLVFGPWRDPQGFNFPQSMNFARDTLLPRPFTGSRLHAGFFVTLIFVAIATVFLFRTFAGYRLQVGGLAPAAARYAGFSARKSLWLVLLVSGGFAGMAGAMEVMGPIGQLTPFVSNGYGFTAIIVAFLGRLHPVGCLFAGFLLSMFLIGGELAQSRLGLPPALTGVFQGLLLFALLACDTLIEYRVVFGRRRAAHA